jgi:uncharacterized protein YjaG (DUF416 family)
MKLYSAGTEDALLGSRLVTSLAYLCRVNRSEPVRRLLSIAADLCYSVQVLDGQDVDVINRDVKVNGEDCLEALQYLRDLASEHSLDDVEMILDACFKLCFLVHYVETRGAYREVPLSDACNSNKRGH